MSTFFMNIVEEAVSRSEDVQLAIARGLLKGMDLCDGDCFYQLAAAARVRHPVLERLGIIVSDDDYLDYLTSAVCLGSDKARIELALLMYVSEDLPWEGDRKPDLDEEWADELIWAADARDRSEESGLSAAFQAWSYFKQAAESNDPQKMHRAMKEYEYALSCDGAGHLKGLLDCGITDKKAFAKVLWNMKNNSWPVFSIYGGGC